MEALIMAEEEEEQLVIWLYPPVIPGEGKIGCASVIEGIQKWRLINSQT